MRKAMVLLAVILVMSAPAFVHAADDCNIVRYVDNLDGTMTDCRSNLTWLKDANCKSTSNGVPNPTGDLAWADAMQWAAGLQNGICGLTDGSAAGDWRLPTKTEFMAMIISAKKQGFTNPTFTTYQGTSKWTEPAQTYDFQNVQVGFYWTSTTSLSNTNVAWDVALANGNMLSDPKTDHYYVWPVRGGQSGTFGSVRIE
jgi:hypothetical protein